MGSWLEVWRRPGHATFGRVIDDPPFRSATLHDNMTRVGDGTMDMPSSFDRFDDILFIDRTIPADSESSLIRVFSDQTSSGEVVFEWLPNMITPTADKRDPFVDVGGKAIKSILSYARTEAWDWDGSDFWPAVIPDWVYGGPNILQNPGFETTPFPNGGFEDGDNDFWQPTQADGFLTSAASVQAVFNPGAAESGDWYGLVDPISAKSGAVRTFSGLIAGETYTITGFLQDPTASGDRWRAGVSGATGATHTNAYEADGYWWAELDNAVSGGGASDGTWQTFTLTFAASAGMVSLAIIFDDAGAGPTFRLDTWTISGQGVGLYPWEARYPNRTYTFEYQTTTVHSGLGAAVVQGDDLAYTSPFGATGYGRVGIQQAVSLVVGQPYVNSVWVRQNSGSDQTFKMTITRQSPLGEEGSPGSAQMATEVAVVPTGVWTKITDTFTADVTEAWFYVSWMYTGAFDTSLHPSPTYYIDDASLVPGLPPTTVGDILTQLYDDATSNHPGRIVWEDEANPGTPYLTLDFDDALDSNGDAWLHPELTVRIWMRQTFLQVVQHFENNYGYEFRVVPGDIEAGTWLLQGYNPGGMGVDYTTAASPAIQGGAADINRQIRRFLPATQFLVEGLERTSARDEDIDLTAALGRIETSRITREIGEEDGLLLAASEDVVDNYVGTEPWSYELVNPQDQPLTVYGLGDLLTVHDPPEVDGAGRLWDVVATFSPDEGEHWEVEFMPEGT